jgi:hypothetical protein
VGVRSGIEDDTTVVIGGVKIDLLLNHFKSKFLVRRTKCLEGKGCVEDGTPLQGLLICSG